MDTSSRDSGLIIKCIDGNEEAWHVFVDRFSRLVYYSISRTAHSLGVVLDSEDVEDMYNGVFLSLVENDYRKLRQYEGKLGCTLASWIRMIAMRHTIDFLRRKKETVSLDSENNSIALIDTLHDKAASIHDRMEVSEMEKLMHDAIASLPSSDRLFMALYYEKELSPEEIAGILNVAVSTVYSKKNRIKAKLEKILNK